MNIIEDPKLPVKSVTMINVSDLEKLLVEVYDAENPTILLNSNLVELTVTGHGNAKDAETVIAQNDSWLTNFEVQLLLDDLADMGYVKRGEYVVKQ